MERFRYQILFYIRKDRKNKKNECPIYMRISINRKRATTSTGWYISDKYWNHNKQCVKSSFNKAAEINTVINHLKTNAHIIRNKLIDAGKVYSARSIINELYRNEDKIYSLIEIYTQHNAEMVSMLGKGYAASYFKNHKSTKKHLSEFIQSFYKTNDLPISEVNNSFIVNFVHFLRTIKNNNHNGAMKNLVRLKKIIRIALHNDWLSKDPFMNYKMTFQKYDRIYLNQHELQIFEEANLDSLKLIKVRDVFIFSCYTGLSYADIKLLHLGNIVSGIDGNLWVSANRKKSGIRYTLPLLPKALDILKKYQHESTLDTTNSVFPVMSNQKMNQYLKDIAKLCGITKSISFHSARHTFATTVTLVNGVPIETISKMLGHTDISTTQIYARVIDDKIAIDMNALLDKLNNK